MRQTCVRVHIAVPTLGHRHRTDLFGFLSRVVKTKAERVVVHDGMDQSLLFGKHLKCMLARIRESRAMPHINSPGPSYWVGLAEGP